MTNADQTRSPARSLTQYLCAPVDGGSSAAFRVLFGVVMAISLVRFWGKGWIAELYLEPAYLFTYWGFGFVKPPPGPWMYAVFAVLIGLCLLITIGRAYRPAIVGFFFGFTYVELLDQTNYLNHYYFISIVAALMCLMPLDRAGRARVPRWVPWALRAQIGIVYVFAGIAKLEPDWLVAAQPLKIWLHARADLPVVGPWLSHPWVAYAMAWGGALFDLTIVGWLLWRRTRTFAYIVVVAFHLSTGLLFNIGMFPWVMISLTPIFFDPRWPRRVFGAVAPTRSSAPSQRTSRWCLAVLTVHFTVQLALPLRHLLYPGDERWHDQGFRFSWNVMLIEKTGMVQYRVYDPASGRRWRLNPARELTQQQTKMMAIAPDLILQYAHHLRAEFAAIGYPNVEIRADAWASLNGRPSRRLIDREIDLLTVDEGWIPKSWVTPTSDHRTPDRLLR